MLESNWNILKIVFHISLNDDQIAVGFQDEIYNFLEPGLSELTYLIWNIVIDRSIFRMWK